VDVISALEQSYDQTAKLVAGLTPAALNAPSPCAGWDVRATLNHLLGTTWMFTLVNQGQTADEDAGDVIGDDASLAVTAATKENLASWRQPGAFEGDRSYFFGTFPAVGQMIYDWGVSIPLDDFRDHGAFGPEVAVSASASIVDRLVGLLGRQP
jgi:uncharacterized protein (TIGR03083 family)